LKPTQKHTSSKQAQKMAEYRLRIRTPPTDDEGNVIQSPIVYLNTHKLANLIYSKRHALYLMATLSGLLSLATLVTKHNHSDTDLALIAIQSPVVVMTLYKFCETENRTSV
jgi:hypothetical protein